VSGLWIIPTDFDEISRLFSRNDGWIFTAPMVLVTADIYLTLIGLSQGNWELNPFVAAAVPLGPRAIIPFLVSYMALSEGLALLMLRIGKWLFGANHPARFLPFSLVCGVASIGPVSNAELLALPSTDAASYLVGVIFGTVSLSVGLYMHWTRLQGKARSWS